MESNEELPNNKLQRVLKQRHLVMIGMGGGIGTGLFFASGNAVSSSGPGGAMLAYFLMSVLVYFLMTSLGEMATFLPVSGSFETYATRFIDPALGFAIGWNYWFCWAITVASELSASALIMKFWFPHSIGWLWSAAFLAILFTLNIFSARVYGEAEYWFASIKVAIIVIFLIVGVLMIFGVLGGKSPGFTNWLVSSSSGEKGPFVGGFLAISMAFFTAGYSMQGTEVVGLTAGESQNPEKDIPKAIGTVIWRILTFYIGAIAIIGFIIPWTDPNLLNSSGVTDVAISPFTLVFVRCGIPFAASIMNVIILTAILSCGNSGLYAATRIMYTMSKEGKAPKMLSAVNKRGVPMNALYFTCIIAMTSFLSSFLGDGKIYIFLFTAAGVTGFLAWLGIALCHYRFRKAYIAQGYKLEDLKYKAKFYPFGPLFAIVLSVIVILGVNIGVFMSDTINWPSVIANYIAIPFFIIMYIGYKIVKKTKVVPLLEVDFSIDGKKENSDCIALEKCEDLV
jgi:lysine-specific permease